MEVKVKLFATLREKSPEKLPVGEAFTLQLKDDSSVNDLLIQLTINRKEAKIVMINHITVLDFTKLLKNGDKVAIFPPVGGGSFYR